MSRSTWKPIYTHQGIIKASSSTQIPTHSRSTFISQSIIGWTFQVYNGIRWFTVKVLPEMVGQCLGQFAPTRKRPLFKKKVTKIIKTKK